MTKTTTKKKEIEAGRKYHSRLPKSMDTASSASRHKGEVVLKRGNKSRIEDNITTVHQHCPAQHKLS